MEYRQAFRFERRQKAEQVYEELSFFNVIMAATYFRRAARARHPDAVRDIGREYLAKAGRVRRTHGS
jgi:hypothetical protein